MEKTWVAIEFQGPDRGVNHGMGVSRTCFLEMVCHFAAGFGLAGAIRSGSLQRTPSLGGRWTDLEVVDGGGGRCVRYSNIHIRKVTMYLELR